MEGTSGPGRHWKLEIPVTPCDEIEELSVVLRPYGMNSHFRYGQITCFAVMYNTTSLMYVPFCFPFLLNQSFCKKVNAGAR